MDSSKNILLLQGPVGPFFQRFSHDLSAHGHRVYKINFNGGDRAYFDDENCHEYKDGIAEWPKTLELRIKEWHIHRIYLFGDSRSYHRIAHEVAQQTGIEVYTFEEGYLRPHYITLEKDGVNGRSSIPRNPAAYKRIGNKPAKQPKPVSLPFYYAAWYATRYVIACWLSRKEFPHYRHHRNCNPYIEFLLWNRSLYRYYWFKFKERNKLKHLIEHYNKRFFLLPLQVHNDAQIKTWSTVPSAAAFIRRTINSFSKYASPEDHLVIKHHPLDRGYADYKHIIAKLAHKFRCAERVHYVHDLHLPTLLNHAKGTVTLNSTVGLSSILHGTPVKTSGHAIYDIEGLTSQQDLRYFWNNPGSVDKQLNQKFRNYLILNNQVNGNFYRRISEYSNQSGMDLKQHLEELGRSAVEIEQPFKQTTSSLTKKHRSTLIQPLQPALHENIHSKHKQAAV